MPLLKSGNTVGWGPQREVFYRDILDSMADGVYFVDARRRITYWNRGAESISGYSGNEVLGRSCGDNLLVHTDAEGCQLCSCGCPLTATFANGENRQVDLFLKHRDGHRVPVSVRVSPIYDSGGSVIGGVEVFSENASKLAALEKAREMERLALLDPLTNTGNRRYTEKVILDFCDRYRRDGDRFSALFLDIDHFKAINDTHGHEAGDAVLKAISRTIANSLRSFDFLGRWGGEEFIAVLSESDQERLKAVAARCCALVRSCVVDWEGIEIRSTISIGVVLSEPGESPNQLIARADARLYEAKQSGRDQFRGP
jgi:diguanylate cyclase (GGDEF)-like protein/PAS domain S-box-containing protein